MLVFEITVPNRESLSATESIQLFMDTDRNGQTGSNGADFALSMFGRSGRVYIDKWTGSSFARQRQSLDSGFAPRSLTMRARQSELSLSGYIEFWIVTYLTTEPYVAGDRTARWHHNMTAGTTAATTTPQGTVASVDTDKDGILDGSDKCLRQKAGPYDFNRNGCPGPFKTMSLTLTNPSTTSDNYTWWTSDRPAILGGGAPGARVVIDDAIRSESGRTDTRGRYRSRLLGTSKYALGRVITLQVTKPGWIGSHWEIKILNRHPGWSTYRTLCISPSGGSPKDCRHVDRGS